MDEYPSPLPTSIYQLALRNTFACSEAMASTVSGRFDNYLRQLCPDNMPSLGREQVAAEGIGRAGDTDGRWGAVVGLSVLLLVTAGRKCKAAMEHVRWRGNWSF